VVPEDKDARDVIAIAFNKYDISLGAGLTEVMGKVFRIGHIGDMNDVSMLGAIAGVENPRQQSLYVCLRLSGDDEHKHFPCLLLIRYPVPHVSHVSLV
jgi:hypothetical protein